MVDKEISETKTVSTDLFLKKKKSFHIYLASKSGSLPLMRRVHRNGMLYTAATRTKH